MKNQLEKLIIKIEKENPITYKCIFFPKSEDEKNQLCLDLAEVLANHDIALIEEEDNG